MGADEARARNDHSAHSVFDFFAFEDFRSGAQIFDAAIGAGPDEHGVDFDVCQFLTGCEAHVFDGTCSGVDFTALKRGGFWNNVGDWQNVFWGGAPCDGWCDVFALERDNHIPFCVVVRIEGFPPCLCGFPFGAFWCVWATFTVVVCCLVRGNQACACTALNRHVTDGHATFHGQILDRGAAIFDDVACTAACTGFTDDRHGDVFRGHARFQVARDFDLHVFGFFLDQRLRGQNVFHLGCADAVSERAECAMCRGVAVAAHNCHARQCPTLFRANDVHDALTDVGHGVVVDAEVLGVFVQRVDLDAAVFGHCFCVRTVQCCWNVVIWHCDCFFWCADLTTGHAQTLKSLR